MSMSQSRRASGKVMAVSFEAKDRTKQTSAPAQYNRRAVRILISSDAMMYRKKASR